MSKNQFLEIIQNSDGKLLNDCSPNFQSMIQGLFNIHDHTNLPVYTLITDNQSSNVILIEYDGELKVLKTSYSKEATTLRRSNESALFNTFKTFGASDNATKTIIDVLYCSDRAGNKLTQDEYLKKYPQKVSLANRTLSKYKTNIAETILLTTADGMQIDAILYLDGQFDFAIASDILNYIRNTNFETNALLNCGPFRINSDNPTTSNKKLHNISAQFKCKNFKQFIKDINHFAEIQKKIQASNTISANKGELDEIIAKVSMLQRKPIVKISGDKNDVQYQNITRISYATSKGIVDYCAKNNTLCTSFANKSYSEITAKELEDTLNQLKAVKDNHKTGQVIIPQHIIDKICPNQKIKSSQSSIGDITIHDKKGNKSYNIKSSSGAPVTIFNDGKGATTVKIAVSGLTNAQIDSVNKINNGSKVIDRINAIKNYGGQLMFSKMVNKKFEAVLKSISPNFPQMMSDILISAYVTKNKNIMYNAVILSKMHNNPEYIDCAKMFLILAARGGITATKVLPLSQLTDGEVFIDKPNFLAIVEADSKLYETEMTEKTYFETPASHNYEFGRIYEEGGNYYIYLAVQVRYNAKEINITQYY